MNYKNGNPIVEKENKNGNSHFLEEVFVENFGTVYGCQSRLYEAVERLSKENASLISARELAYAQSAKGKGYLLCNYGSMLKETVISIPDFGNVLTKDFPLIKRPEFLKSITLTHEKNEDFFIDEKLAGEYKEKVKNSSPDVLLLKNLEDFVALPVKNFPFDKRAIFLFENEAERMKQFIETIPLKEMSFHFDSLDNINYHGRPYVNQLYITQLDSSFSIYGNFKCLGDKKCLVRGLKKC